jgi:hypothetical protein
VIVTRPSAPVEPIEIASIFREKGTIANQGVASAVSIFRHALRGGEYCQAGNIPKIR